VENVEATKDKEREEQRRKEAMEKAAAMVKSVSKPDLMKRFGDFDLLK
jgi:hypothetical protein